MVENVDQLTMEVPLSPGESDIFSDVPLWSLWLSTIVLSLAFIIGLPLNGATVLIFWRRKKLRHLVNFVLLLDCLSHIILCLVCIPIHIVTVWSCSTLAAAGYTGLVVSQQVVGNFSNIYSTFLTVSIAILRYRRLCWKKKDKFSTSNAIKWSVFSGCVALGLTITQSYSKFWTDNQRRTLIFYLVKISPIMLSISIVFFCYIRVSQRVWANAASHEKVMDPIKLKKSRSVHLRATIHSCVQIILVIATLSPHLYEQTLDALHASNFQFAQASSSISTMGDGSGLLPHDESSTAQNFDGNFIIDGASEEMMTTSSPSVMRAHSGPLIQEDSSTSSNTLSSSDNHLARLIGITINYALLVLGTPMAYIASCHRFREQFTSILFSHIMNSPQNSACHQNSQRQHGQRHRNNSNSSSVRGGTGPCKMYGNRHCPSRFYSNPVSKIPFSSSSNTRTATTSGNPSSGITRNSISISTNNGSIVNHTVSRSLAGSVKSNRSSQKRTATGLSVKRKSSRGLLGADFIIADSDSTAILQVEDLSNSKGTPTPSPTMTEKDNDCNVSCRGGHSHYNNGFDSGKKGNPTAATRQATSIFCSSIQGTVTTITNCNNPNNLHTILQNYGYEFEDFGQLV